MGKISDDIKLRTKVIQLEYEGFALKFTFDLKISLLT